MFYHLILATILDVNFYAIMGKGGKDFMNIEIKSPRHNPLPHSNIAKK